MRPSYLDFARVPCPPGQPAFGDGPEQWSSDVNGVLGTGHSNKAGSQCAGVRLSDELPILGHCKNATNPTRDNLTDELRRFSVPNEERMTVPLLLGPEESVDIK
jgi:hypothetical protein